MGLQHRLQRRGGSLKYLALFLLLTTAHPALGQIAYDGTAYRVDGIGPFVCLKRQVKPAGVDVVAGFPVGPGGVFEQWLDRYDGQRTAVIITGTNSRGDILTREVKPFGDVPPPMRKFLRYLATTPAAQATCGR